MKNFLVSVRIFSNSKFLFILFLLIAGLFLRFFELQTVPISLYHDEMDYVITGESLVRFGSDITGTWVPWQLRPIHTENITAEFPAIFHAAFQSIFGVGFDSAHVPAAVFGLGSVVLIGLIFYKITHSKLMAVSAALFLLINPSHIHISRTAYEAGIAVFFLLLLLLSAIHAHQKNNSRKMIFISIIGLVIGATGAYFSYHAAKFIVLTLLLLCSLVFFIEYLQSKNFKHLLLFILPFLLSICFATVSYFGFQSGWYGNRESEIFFTLDNISSVANTKLHSSVENTFQPLLINKLTVSVDEVLRKIFYVFDPYRLLILGQEDNFQFSLSVHGYFYLSSLVFIPLGAIYLFKKHKQIAVIVFLVLLVSPIASILANGYQSVFRSAVTYALLAGIEGVGAVTVYLRIMKSKWKKIGVFAGCLLISFQVSWFGLQYFTRYSVVSADNHYFFEKLLASYVDRVERPIKIILDDQVPYSSTRSIISYLGLMPSLSEEERTQFLTRNKTFTVDSITLTNNCPNWESEPNLVVEASMLEHCEFISFLATASAETQSLFSIKKQNSENIVTLKALGSPIDSRAYYYLLSDTVCSNDVGIFTQPKSLKDFKLFSLTDSEFCDTWVKREEFSFPITAPSVM